MRFRLTPLALALAVAAPVAGAQPAAAKPAPASMPAAKEIVARHVTAIGGRDAILKRKSIRSMGTFEMPAAGLKGELTLVQATPDKMAMRVSIPGLGDLLSGYDGTVGWSVNPMQGARVLDGKELAAMKEDAGLRSLLREGEGRTLETVGKAEMGGQPCWQVKVTYPSQRSVTECYSVESGLLVGTTTSQESPMGVIQVTTLVGEYKDFGGVKMPTSARMQMMGQEQVMTISSVEYDGAEDAKAFERPAAVTTIIEQKAKAATP
jgi:hypothetical protein